MATTKHNKIKLREVNRHLVCRLCRGYYVDATTIAECLHSFCRSCIIKYLEKNSFCPICEVQIHKTKPYLSLRLDKALQDVVYKVVPGLYHDEMRRRREFYSEQKERLPCATPEQCGLEERIIFSPEDSISLSLEYLDSEYLENETLSSQSSDSGDTLDSFALTQHLNLKLKPNDKSSRRESQDSQEPSFYPRRYLQCPAVVNIGHLKKFVRMKHELHSKAQVDIIHKRVPLPDHYTLMDVAYIYTWKRSAPLRLFYQIYKTKKQKVIIPTSLPEAKNTESRPLKDLNKEKSEVNNKVETSSAVKTSKVNKNTNEAVSNPVGKLINDVQKSLNDFLALKTSNINKSGPDNKTKETAKPVTSVNGEVRKDEPSCGEDKTVSPFKNKISDKIKLSDKVTLEIKSKTERSSTNTSKVRKSSAEEVRENKLNHNERLLLNPVSGQLEPVPFDDYSNSALGRVEDKKDKINSSRKEKESKRESPSVRKIKENKNESEFVKKEKIKKKDSTDVKKEKVDKKEFEIGRKEKIHKKESASAKKEKVSRRDSENMKKEKEPKKEVEHIRKEKEQKKEVEHVRKERDLKKEGEHLRKEKEPKKELEHLRKEKEQKERRQEFEHVRKAIDQKKEFEHIRKLIEQKKEAEHFRKEDEQKRELEYVRKAIEQRKEFELLRKVIEQKQEIENARKESEAKKELEHIRKEKEQKKELEHGRKENEQKKEVEHVRRDNDRRESEHLRREKEPRKELENVRKEKEQRKEVEHLRRENERRQELEQVRKEKEAKKELEHVRKEKEPRKESEHVKKEKEPRKESEHVRKEKEPRKEAEYSRKEKEQKKEVEHARKGSESRKESEHVRKEKEPRKELEHARKGSESRKESEHVRKEKEPRKESEHVRRGSEPKKESEHVRKEKEPRKESEHVRRGSEPRKESEHVRRGIEPRKESEHVRRGSEPRKESEHVRKEKEQKKELEHMRKEKEEKNEGERMRRENEPKKEAEQVRKPNEAEHTRKEGEKKVGEVSRNEDEGKKVPENLLSEKEQKGEQESVKKDELENVKKQREPNKEPENVMKEKEQKGDSENLMKEKEPKKEEESEKKSNLNILKSFRKEKQSAKETKIELKTSNGSTLTITALPRSEKPSETDTCKVSTELKEENVYEFDGTSSPEKNDIFTKQMKHSKSKYLTEHRDKWLAKEAASEWMTFQEYREMLLKENNQTENLCTRAKRKSVPNLFRISPEESKRSGSKEYIGKLDETPKEKKALPNLFNMHTKEEDKKTAASKNSANSPPRPIKIENKDGEYFIKQDNKEMNGKSQEAEKQKKDDKYNLYHKLMENYQAKMGEVNKRLKTDESGSKNFGPIDLTKGETNSKERKNCSENVTDKPNNSLSKPEEKTSSKMSLEPLLKVPQYAQNFKNSTAKDWPPVTKNLSPNDLTQAFLHLKHLDAINQFNPNAVLEQFAKKTGNLDLLYQQKIDFIRRLKRHQQATEDSTPEKKQKFSPSADKRHSPTSDAKEKTKPNSEEVAALKNAEDLKTLSRIQDLLEIQRAVTQNFKMPPALLQFYSRPRPYPPPIPPNLSNSQTHSPSHPKSQNLGSTSRSLALPMPNASMLDSPNYGHLLSASGIHTEMSFHQTFKNYLRRQEESPQMPNLPLLKKLPRLKEESGKSISDKHHNSKAPAAKQEPTESLDTPET